MGVASKLAKHIAKTKKPSVKRQMVEKTNKELEGIVSKTTGDSEKGMAARNELTRREERKSFKKGEPTWKGETLKDSEAPKFKIGGMAKALVKKPAVKNPIKKGK
jgi:hypothetical protein